MYEELVKRIRGCIYSDPNGCEECHDCPNAENYYECKQKLALQAADAIETLIEVIQNHDFLERLIKPRWIPVTERLPKAYEEVLLLFPHNQAAGFCDRDGCWAVYSGDGFYTEVADNETKPTHWCRRLAKDHQFDGVKEEAT